MFHVKHFGNFVTVYQHLCQKKIASSLTLKSLHGISIRQFSKTLQCFTWNIAYFYILSLYIQHVSRIIKVKYKSHWGEIDMKKNRRNLSTLAILFTIATGAIHFINKSIIASASNKNLINSSINHHFYQWRFGRIYYTKQGSGKPLLLIHDLQAGA